MDRVHDLGGMRGFGPIEREENEPVFHEPWEGRVRVMMALGLRLGVYNIDEFRWAVERMDPASYLSASYYEKWLDGIERLYVEKGVIEREELERRLRSKQPSGRSGEQLIQPPGNRFRSPQPVSAQLPAAHRPRFVAGDKVVARDVDPQGHTRLPRYVRGKKGIVHHVRGTYALPDRSAMGHGEHPEYVYSIRFEARDLWGPQASTTDAVYIDLWESYLKEGTAGGARSSAS